MSEVAQSASELLSSRQRAFLLHQLASATGGKSSQSEVNTAIPTQFKKELNLTAKAANSLRHEMATFGWIGEETSGRNVTYSITEAGRRQLRDLDRYIPLRPAKGTVNPPPDGRVRVAREVYVLDALSRAAGQTISKHDMDIGFGGTPKLKVAELAAKHPDVVAFRDQHCVGLNQATARAVLAGLALRGDVSVHRTATSESYALTASGFEQLGRLRGECPVLPPAGKPTPAPNESIRRGRQAFLLLKLLEAPESTVSGTEARGVSYPKPFKLNHATAWQVRGELARDGYVKVHWSGREGFYSLTPGGKRYLATLPFDAFGEFKIDGATLTELLAAARDGAVPSATGGPNTPQPRTPLPTPDPEQLKRAVMDDFDRLLRGPFANLRMVPIHELRSAAAERFGPHAVSHADFNELLLALRRDERVRLIAIDDRSRATSSQLRDSISAFGETFFYAERVHAFAQGG